PDDVELAGLVRGDQPGVVRRPGHGGAGVREPLFGCPLTARTVPDLEPPGGRRIARRRRRLDLADRREPPAVCREGKRRHVTAGSGERVHQRGGPRRTPELNTATGKRDG